jgi:ribosomal protein L27
MGRDHTIFATRAGAVEFRRRHDDKIYVSVKPNG